ncbi:MAG: hypothetical protein ACREIN_00860 [Candidatus Methylomirabilaceae bacterium]
MTREVRLFLFIALVFGATPILALGAPFGAGTPERPIPEVKCSVSVNKVTHKYTEDGRATYAMPGMCSALVSDGVYQGVRYHVDAVWNPAEETAHETGRIYDLGSIWPMFQRGGSTLFINRYQCKGGDPWLGDSRCGLLGSTASDELKRVLPRLT